MKKKFPGKFWQNRYRAVRLIDDEAILACAAYVDLNPIRAGIAQTIEDSQFTSARLRSQTIVDFHSSADLSSAPVALQASTEFKAAIDSFVAPVEIDELNDLLGARASTTKYRCSDKGFLAMPTAAYLELLDVFCQQSSFIRPATTSRRDSLLPRNGSSCQ